MTVYATINDLTERFPRDLTGPETALVPTLLEDASFWLSVWVPDLDAAVTGGNEAVTTAAKLLVVSMVKRSLLSPVPDNPGVQSTTEAWGTYNQSVTYRNPEGNLYLYGRELGDITGLLRSSRATAVSMRSPGL